MKATLFIIILMFNSVLHLFAQEKDIPETYLSKHFKVQYTIATHDSTAQVFHTQSNQPDTRGFDVSWTNIPVSQGQETLVRIKGTETIKEAVIRPRQQHIDYNLSEGVLELKLKEPIKMSVEINGDSLHPLYLFAYENKQKLPKQNEIVRFAPGYHAIGEHFLIKSNTTYVLERGAYLKGSFYAKGTVENVTFTGQGVIDAGEQTWQHPLDGLRSNIQFEDGRNIRIEGITLINAGNFQFKLQTKANGTGIKFKGVNMIGWNRNTDGIHISDMDWKDHPIVGNGKNTKLTVEDCFIRANDDAILLCDGVAECTVRNCYFVDDGDGATFCLSWGAHQPVKKVRVSQCYILSKQKDNPVFRANHAGKAHINNVIFKDIYIEGNANCLVGLYITPHRYDPDPAFGSISNIRFENIYLQGKCKANFIHGLNKQHRISDVRFKNLYINGKHITSAEEGLFSINEFTENISFE